MEQNWNPLIQKFELLISTLVNILSKRFRLWSISLLEETISGSGVGRVPVEDKLYKSLKVTYRFFR